MFDAVCAGILCADVLAKPVNELPQKGKLELIDDLKLQIGGCASNAAIDLSRMGVRTAILGKIGNDGFGDFIKEGMSKENIDITGLKTADDIQTSASVVAINKDGERSILHCLGANSRFCFEDIDLDILNDSKLLFIAGTFLMPSLDGEGTLKLLEAGRRAGAITCMDTAWDSTGSWIKKIKGSISLLDWFMPSYDEAVMLSGQRDPEKIALDFSRKGARNIVIKLGEEGCFVKPFDSPGFYSPAFKVDTIDTSGAGDAFCAGFITGIIKGWETAECARYANAAGAACVSAIGTTSGIRDFDQIREIMDEK